MSEVMKALQQSEQAYQATSVASSSPSSTRVVTIKTTSWWLSVLLVLLPVLAVIFTLFYLNQTWSREEVIDERQWNEKSISIDQNNREDQKQTLEQHPLSSPVNNVLARVLPYPEFDTLTALPEAMVIATPVAKTTSKLAQSQQVNSSSEGKRIQTDQVKASHSSEQNWNTDNLDLSGLSPELAERFKSALKANPQPESTRVASSVSPSSRETINLLEHEKEYQGRLPRMNFETHMYSSKPQSRWIKVNGNNVHEGEWVIGSSVKLEEILPGSLIVSFDGQKIEIPALYEWQG